MIRAYAGGLGSGKSYSMVEDATKWMRQRRGQIYTNMAGLSCPEAIYIDSLHELVGVSSGLLLLDEASVALASRFWQQIPRDLLTRFAQLRKHGMDLWYTTQAEARVDTVVREITNETVHCSKFLGGHWRRTVMAGQKEHMARTWHPFKAQIFGLYDTLEVIGTHGGSVGRGETALRLSAVARRTQSEHVRRQAEVNKRLFVPMIVWRDQTPVMLPEAVKVRAWLFDHALIDPAVTVADQVQVELQRRRWLASWGLGPEDAPYHCRRLTPWLTGFTPAEVKARRAEAEAMQKAQELIEYAGGRSSARRGKEVS